MIFQNCLKNFTRLTAREITYYNILKYHSWFLCQISLLIMVLPILIKQIWKKKSNRKNVNGNTL